MTREQWLTTLGSAVRDGRLEMGWTQTELGMKLDLSRSSVANIEAGRQDVPSSTAAYLATLLGIELPGWRPSPSMLNDQFKASLEENRRLRRLIEAARRQLDDA